MAIRDLSSGSMVSQRYKIEAFLGRGSLGRTYLARDLQGGDARVVLRVLSHRRPTADEINLLRQEFSLLSRLRHPNLVRMLDFGVIARDRIPFVVDEYVDGQDLLQATVHWTTWQIVQLLVALCRVVQYLHVQGVAHRNLKPSNAFILSGDSDSPSVKLMDFGLAHCFRLGKPGAGGGTLAYTAPEILLGEPPTARADLYSIGIIAYQLLTRRLPFEEDDQGYLIQKHLQGKADLRPVERLEAGAGLAQAINALLGKDPERRPSSAEDVIRLLSAATGNDYSSTVPIPAEGYFSAGRFVGREHEMAFLQEKAIRVRDTGRGWTVFLSGESGSGKTRCMEELRLWALLEGFRIIEAACLAREKTSYGPYRQILAKTDRFYSARLDPSQKEEIFRFDEFPKPTEAPSFELAAESAAGQFRDLVTREIVRRVADRPTVLFLHDVHWADEATLAVLDYLTSDILAYPVFMCVSLRSGEADQGPLTRLIERGTRQSRGETLILQMLSQEAVESLVASLTRGSQLGRLIGGRLYKSSGGNPFFVEEILKHLVDRKLLRREHGQWRLEQEGFDIAEVPESVAAVLRSRLGQLSPQTRELTEWLAVLGRALPKDLLAFLTSRDSSELSSALEELLTRQIIRKVTEDGQECFEFRHALISEVICADLATGHRRSLHRKIGEVLEQRYPVEEHLQELALHFTEARHGEKAVQYALKAAAACKSEYANQTALHFYEYALANRRYLSRKQLCEAAIQAADACCALGLPKRGIRTIERVLDSSDDASSQSRSRLYLQLSRCFQFSGNLPQSHKAAAAGMKLLKRTSVTCRLPSLEAALLAQMAFCTLAKPCALKALALCQRALDLLSSSNDEISLGHLYVLKAGLSYVACDFREGCRASLKAIHYLEGANAMDLLPMSYSHLAINLDRLGKVHSAIEQGERAIAIGTRTRSAVVHAQSMHNLAESCQLAGQFARANQVSEEMLRIASSIENPSITCAGNTSMLDTYRAIGDYPRALEKLKQISSTNLEWLPVYARAQTILAGAWLKVELGDFESALRDLHYLKRMGSGESLSYEQGFVRILLGRIYHYRRKTGVAIRLLRWTYLNAIQRHWAYQTCMAAIWLGTLLLRQEDLQGARRNGRIALRLAHAMRSQHLEAEAHLLVAAIHFRLLANSRVSGSPITARDGDSQSKIHVDDVRCHLERAVGISKHIGTRETLWRAEAELAGVEDFCDNREKALLNAQAALGVLSSLEQSVPSALRERFVRVLERAEGKEHCERLISRHRRGESTDVLAVGELEADHLRILFRFSSVVNSLRDLGEVVDAILDLVHKALATERAAIFLTTDGSGGFRLKAARNARGESIELSAELDAGVLEHVYGLGHPFVSANIQGDPRISRFARKTNWLCATVFCSPLRVRGRTVGLLYADSQIARQNIAESTINLFAAFCNLAAVAIDNALASENLIREKADLEKHLRQAREGYLEIVGNSAVIQKLRERIALAAASPLDVLIIGESGTGKELVAKALHRTGRRAANSFVPVDCGSLSDTLVESEFFGYRKGAFTGAIEHKVGLLEAAQGGVLFLDEVSNLPMPLQGKLLRVLQEREFRKIGETVQRKLDVQIIAATNKDLGAEIRKGRFRRDLFYRLNGMEIRIPSLREHLEDVPLLVESFLARTAQAEGGRTKRFAAEAIRLLTTYHYPGNVRQLRNIVQSSYYLSPGNIIGIEHLPMEVRGSEVVGDAPAEGEGNVRDIYSRIREGTGDFDSLVKRPFLQRCFGSGVVRQVIYQALVETAGRYRDAFRLLRIPEDDYSIMMQFLKRHRCYLDFRSFRRGTAS